MTADVEAHLQVAKIARDHHNNGLSAAAILTRIEVVTGPDVPAPPPPPRPGGREDFRPYSLRNLASDIGMMRRRGMSDDRIVYSLMSWTETPLPNFRRL